MQQRAGELVKYVLFRVPLDQNLGAIRVQYDFLINRLIFPHFSCRGDSIQL